jgi:hypothetical protein
MKRHFDNMVEKDSAPKWYTGKLLFEMVKNIQVVFGKGTVKGQKRKKTPPFKKQSIFSCTFHTRILKTCHIIGTLLDMSRKTKDGLKSRNDLVQFSLRPELHPILRPNGKHYLPLVSYSLTIEEKKHSFSAYVGCEYPQVSHPTSPN